MGEFADDDIERIIDYMGEHGWSGPRYRRRQTDAYGPPLTCRNCGAGNLYWQIVRGEPVMYDRATITPHVCQESNLAEGFTNHESDE